MIDEPVRAADISACGRYRWTLHRRWSAAPVLLVVMLNPSTADGRRDDPTIQLLSQIAAHNGYGGLVVVNLCPLRSSRPADAFELLDRAQDYDDRDARQVMRQNLEVIEGELEKAGAALIAWGSAGGRAGTWYSATMERLTCARVPLFHLGRCANGHPKHPLARGKHKVRKDARFLHWPHDAAGA